MNKYFPENAKRIFSSKGKDVLQEIGVDIIKSVVFDVLTGKNLRDSTELLTRKRIITLNAATLAMMVRGEAAEPGFIHKLPEEAFRELKRGGLSKEERWLSQWIVGLNDKAFQNVLRDDAASLTRYKRQYLKITRKAVDEFKRDYGDIKGSLAFGASTAAVIDWDCVVQLMSTIGAQTLAIRGSDKSKFGKLFEKLIMGHLLSILGFKLIDKNHIPDPNRVFWLSSREEKRESDATLLYSPGKGIRFDIGFIGRGNPEISLDKVSRFEREIDLGRQKYFMGTIIIIDRIGRNSRIEALAQKINGNIVQMSGAYWSVQVAKILKLTLGYEHEILNIPTEQLDEYLLKRLSGVDMNRLLDVPVFTEKVQDQGEDLV